MTEEKQQETVQGIVTEALANTHFRVEIPNQDDPDGERQEVIAYLAGKMRLHRIRVIVGDTVELVMDPYGGKPRIVRRN